MQTVQAVHGSNQWQDITVSGNFSSNPHEVDVKFINDEWGGSSATDVNLYVGSVTVSGTAAVIMQPSGVYHSESGMPPATIVAAPTSDA